MFEFSKIQLINISQNSFYLGLLEKVIDPVTEALDTTLFGSLTLTKYDGLKSLFLPSIIFFIALLLFTVISNWQLMGIYQLRKTNLYRSIQNNILVRIIVKLFNWLIWIVLFALPFLAVYASVRNTTAMKYPDIYQNRIILAGFILTLFLKSLAIWLAKFVNPLIKKGYKSDVTSNTSKAVLIIGRVVIWLYSLYEFINIFIHKGSSESMLGEFFKLSMGYNNNQRWLLVMGYNGIIALAVVAPIIYFIDKGIKKLSDDLEE